MDWGAIDLGRSRSKRAAGRASRRRREVEAFPRGIRRPFATVPFMQQQNPEEAAARRLPAATATSDFQTLHEFVAKARQNLNQNAWDYIVGAVETETTLRRNRMALDSVAFRPRVLRDVSKVDVSTEILGRKLRLPIVLCPVGSLESFHPEGA